MGKIGGYIFEIEGAVLWELLSMQNMFRCDEGVVHSMNKHISDRFDVSIMSCSLPVWFEISVGSNHGHAWSCSFSACCVA